MTKNKYTIEDFSKKFRGVILKGDTYTQMGINEDKFDKACHHKSVEVNFDGDTQIVSISWEAQDYCENADPFYEEVKRVFFKEFGLPYIHLDYSHLKLYHFHI